MIIQSIELNNFRNYENLQISFDEGTNILFGDNAQGKTNILEAAYLSGTTKSHKGSKDKEMIRFGTNEAHLRTMVLKNGKQYQIDMHLKHNRSKGIAVNKIPMKKASELFGILNIVFFSPEDLNIIKNGPGERRRFMDAELCQLDKLYLTDLAGYNHVLNQRNKLLKDMYKQPDLGATLDVWDMQLVNYGRKIIGKRREFVESLNEIIKEIHRNLTGGIENIEVIYEPSVESEALEESLFRNRDRDLRMKMTSSGPHRDDLMVAVNGIDIRKYGSQGQQRTAALSLKLSEIYLVEKIIHDKPVLLLDDVLAELDSSRQNYLLESIHDIQTMITCTGLDDFVSHQFTINKVFHVVAGHVYQPMGCPADK